MKAASVPGAWPTRSASRLACSWRTALARAGWSGGIGLPWRPTDSGPAAPIDGEVASEPARQACQPQLHQAVGQLAGPGGGSSLAQGGGAVDAEKFIVAGVDDDQIRFEDDHGVVDQGDGKARQRRDPRLITCTGRSRASPAALRGSWVPPGGRGAGTPGPSRRLRRRPARPNRRRLDEPVRSQADAPQVVSAHGAGEETARVRRIELTQGATGVGRFGKGEDEPRRSEAGDEVEADSASRRPRHLFRLEIPSAVAAVKVGFRSCPPSRWTPPEPDRPRPPSGRATAPGRCGSARRPTAIGRDFRELQPGRATPSGGAG